MQVDSHEIDRSKILELLATVTDPEIPVISVLDLGIVRQIEWDADRARPGFTVTVTPTYSGCPATEVIEQSIRQALEQGGFPNVSIKTRLSPAWTTDWLSDEGREKLREYGIAPPCGGSSEQVIDLAQLKPGYQHAPSVPCPRCGSHDTQVVSQFGSTPCKALYRCQSCKEPFDYFKCH